MIIDCLFGRHRPDRSNVRYDGEVFRGHCKYCGVKLVRLESGWAREHHFPQREPSSDEDGPTSRDKAPVGEA
jgi:hypothetical protein